MKVKELITLVNNNFFYSLHDLDEIENLPKCVAGGLELNQHRWCSTAINVYKCEDGFVGIWGIYQSFLNIKTTRTLELNVQLQNMKKFLV